MAYEYKIGMCVHTKKLTVALAKKHGIKTKDEYKRIESQKEIDNYNYFVSSKGLIKKEWFDADIIIAATVDKSKKRITCIFLNAQSPFNKLLYIPKWILNKPTSRIIDIRELAKKIPGKKIKERLAIQTLIHANSPIAVLAAMNTGTTFTMGKNFRQTIEYIYSNAQASPNNYSIQGLTFPGFCFFNKEDVVYTSNKIYPKKSCPYCGHIWGKEQVIRTIIEEKDIVCSKCGKYKLIQDKEILNNVKYVPVNT